MGYNFINSELALYQAQKILSSAVASPPCSSFCLPLRKKHCHWKGTAVELVVDESHTVTGISDRKCEIN